MQTRTLDNDSIASIKGNVGLSMQKLLRMEPRLRGWRGRLFDWRLSAGQKERIRARDVFEEHLRFGDAGPGVVTSVSPLRVAAYANELDAVVMLEFGAYTPADEPVNVGDRVIAVCTYAPMQKTEGSDRAHYAADIIPGPLASGHFGDTSALIADWLSDDDGVLQTYKQLTIPEQEWVRVEELARQYEDYFGARCRSGRPIDVCFT